MSDPVVPIRAGVTLEFDIERELIDFCQIQLNRFKEGAGRPPTRIAVAVMGDGENGNLHTRCRTWDVEGKTATIENAGLAAALFMQKAVGK